MIRHTPAILLGALLLASPAPAQQEPRAIPAPLAAKLPSLADQSSWAQDTRFEGERPDLRMRGVYPVGNGRVFGHIGLGARANTLLGITGPRYQTDLEFAPKGHFGEVRFEILRADQPVALPAQRVRRGRGANFVVTEDASDVLALRTTTFATPGQTHLTRVVEVANLGATSIDGLQLQLIASEPARAQGDALVVTYTSEQRPALALLQLGGAKLVGSTLVAEVGELAAGKIWTGVATISTVAGSVAPAAWQPVPASLERAEKDAETTWAWWSEKLATTHELATDHEKLQDLTLDWKVMMLAQRCAESGVVSPMVHHRGAWVRESIGPMLAFLRFGMWDEARSILQYFHSATRLLGRVPETVPLDLDFSPLVEQVTDWTTVQVPDSEIPSWVILMHHWYWRVTRDTDTIRAHWPLLEVCLKKQKRTGDTLMTFQGGESYLHGTLHALYPDLVGDDSRFIADDPTRDRRAWSFANSVLFLIALHGMGEMWDGTARALNPESWEENPPDPTPGQKYIDRAYLIMQGIEQRYWLEEDRFFAPALSPVTGEPMRSPVANANLMPLWAGWNFPTGEKSRDNLTQTLSRVWRRGHRIGSTPTVGHATGELQGMLLTALSEHDGRARMDCMDELLRMAEPAGEWGELYDPDGRPVASHHPDWPNRARPQQSGVNLDAILFALSGVRFVAIPNFDIGDIRLELRLPHGATYVAMKDVVKDDRRLRIYMHEVYSPLGPDEKDLPEVQALEEVRNNPEGNHRRLAFRVEHISDDPEKGYWDVVVNIRNTKFIDHLWEEQRVIEKMGFWRQDVATFFPETPFAKSPPPRLHAEGSGSELLVLTARRSGAEILGGDDVTVVDTGMPWALADLAALLVDEDGELVHRALFLDWGWDDPGPATFKRASFWQDTAWSVALARFEAAGGTVLTPGFLVDFEVRRGEEWVAVQTPGGQLELPATGETITVRARFDSADPREAVLRIGTAGGYDARLNGEAIASRRGARQALPDSDSQLVPLRRGSNLVEFDLQPDGSPTLLLRVTDPRGLPVR